MTFLCRQIHIQCGSLLRRHGIIPFIQRLELRHGLTGMKTDGDDLLGTDRELVNRAAAELQCADANQVVQRRACLG